MIKVEYTPKWKPDCSGKEDYDFDLVSLSCRYYPSCAHWMGIIKGTEFLEVPKVVLKPSAKVSILTGDTVNGPYLTLARADIEGDTEQEVKSKVEAWAKEMMTRVELAVRREFNKEVA